MDGALSEMMRVAAMIGTVGKARCSDCGAVTIDYFFICDFCGVTLCIKCLKTDILTYACKQCWRRERSGR
jgi:hypothetical protein